MKKLIFAVLAAATAMSAAQAQQVTPRGYVGVGVATADRQDNIPGASNVSGGDYKASGKLFGGYDFNQTWGLEAGYTDFRKSKHDYTSNGVAGRAEVDGESTYLAAKATAPINERTSMYGKVGAVHNKRTLAATTPGLDRDESKTELYAGVGVQYNINEQVALTAEYERYGKKKDFGPKPDVFTVAAKYSF
jgi:opacity protein-like surface antigen